MFCTPYIPADHDAGTFQKILCEKRIVVITTTTIYESFIRKYSALSGIDADLLRNSHKFRPVKIGESIKLRGGIFNFFYSLHSIPCVGFEVMFGSKSMVFSADHMNDPERIQKMFEEDVLSEGRKNTLLNFPWHHDAILHEAGIPPIHTPMKTLEALPDDVKERLHIVHVSASSIPPDKNLKAARPGVDNTIVLEVDVPEFSEAISILSLIGDIHYFSSLSLAHARGLLEIGYKKQFPAGTIIRDKGSIISDFYVLLTGFLEVNYFEEEESESRLTHVVQWSMGDWFGEEVLLARHDQKVKGGEQIKALTDVEVIVFAGSELHYLFADTKISRRVQHLMQIEYLRLEKLLMFNTTLGALTRAQKLHLESLSEVVSYKANDYVWKVGDPSTFCVIVNSGSLSYENQNKVLVKSLIRRSVSEIVAGEDVNQSYCPSSFEKGAFIGSVTAVMHQHHGVPHGRENDLKANEDTTLLVFRDDHLREFFSTHPGVLLSMMDAWFVL